MRGHKAQRQESTPDEVIATRIDRLAVRKLWVGIIFKILVVVLAFWLVFTFAYGVLIVEDDSMAPSLLDGDLTFYYRLDKDYLAQDVVAYEDENGQTVYSRIIGVPGDQIDYDEIGTLLVNGSAKAIDGERIIVSDTGTLVYPYTVPQDSYYLLNDNLDATADSRTLGAVESGSLRGKVIQLMRRRSF